MVTLEVFNPCGLVGTSNRHAPRLSGLGGRTICELSNGAWEAQRTFPLIRELLRKRFSDASLIPYTEFTQDFHNTSGDEIYEALVAKGCQAVIAGNAG